MRPLQTLLSRLRIAGAIALLLCSAAHAQSSGMPHDEPDDAQLFACLQTLTPMPQPGTGLADVEQTGFLRVRMQFDAADRPASVRVLSDSLPEAARAQMLQYLDGYRLPCLPSGTRADVFQEFILDPALTPLAWPPQRLRAQPAPKCRVEAGPPIKEEELWPRVGLFKAFLQIRFAGAGDQAPEVAVRYASTTGPLLDRVVRYASSYRLPCRRADDLPNTVAQQFMFGPRVRNLSTFKEKSAPLSQFMTFVKGLERQRVYFDFDSMSCPFTVKWTSMRPALPNEARPVGTSSIQRLQFLHWLGQVELDHPHNVLEQLIGESLDIEVPCGRLDLKPSS